MKAIEHSEAISKEITSSALPNNILSGYDFESQTRLCKNIFDLRHAERQTFIGIVETLMRQINLPDVDHAIADHDVLIFKSRLGELCFSLTKASSAARACGYADPYSSSSYISTNTLRVELRSIESQLIDVKEEILKIKGGLKESKESEYTSGVSLSLGPVSADLSTLSRLVTQGIELVKVSASINISALRSVLTSARDRAAAIYSYVKGHVSEFSEHILGAAGRIFKSSNEALRIGLEAMKSAIESDIYEKLSDEQRLAEARRAVVYILQANGIKTSEFNAEKSNGHIYSYVSRIRNTYSIVMEISFNDEKKGNVSLGYFEITKQQADLFDTIGIERLSTICHNLLSQ